MSLRSVLVVLSLLASACGSSQPEPEGASTPTEGTRTLFGVVRHHEPSPVKSVEAYMAASHTIETGDESVPLASTDAVSSERLTELAGREVTLTCVMRPGATPNPNESYPLGPDGQPMQRPARCAVSSVQVK